MPPTALSSPALSMQRLVLEDFDQESVFINAEAHFLNPDARNLVVEFDNSTARVAIDLDQERVREVLQAEVRYNLGKPGRGMGLAEIAS